MSVHIAPEAGAAAEAGPEPTTGVAPLAALVPDPRNARRHDRRNVEAVRASIARDGFGRSLLLAADGTIIAGNATRDAAAEAGLADVLVVETDGSRAIAVKRTDVAPGSPAFHRLALADNRAAELASWDGPRLRALEDDGLVALDDYWTVAELPDGAMAPRPGLTDPDDVPEPPAVPVTQPGDLWRLGRHRLLCGDSTDADTVRRLVGDDRIDCVLTDPPYAIYGSSTGVSSAVADDKMVRPFFRDILTAIRRHLKRYGHAYVFCDWRSWPTWTDVAKTTGMTVCNMIVWDKGDFGLGSNYRNNHELIAFYQSLPDRGSHFDKSSGQRHVHDPNIFRINRTGAGGFESEQEPGRRWHNAAKPVDLCGHLIANSTDPGDTVLDPFLGVGSTLIAADRAGRACFGIEIDPAWCDVAVRRWEAFTGATAERCPAGSPAPEEAQ